MLRLENIAVSAPGPGQALVRLVMAGVNFTDVYRRRGTIPAQLPYTPGLEGSGVVEAVGEGVENIKLGDRVAYAYSGEMGAYAEASVVRATSLIPLPPDISFEQGASFPLQGMSAHYLLHEYRHLEPGDVVLIHAAAGGMGLLLVQWAHHLGARVIGTVSTEDKVRAAREFGADEVILYTQQDFVVEMKRLTKGHGADLIIDGVGKTTFAGNLEAAALRGHIVIYGAASGPPDPILPLSLMSRSLMISGGSLPNYLLSRDELMRRAGDVIEGICAGWLRLRIDKVLPLSQASVAHSLLENRGTIGKVLLSVSGN